MILSIALMLMTAAGEPGGKLGSIPVDAHRLQTGEFIYQDSVKGKVLGESSISIRVSEHDSNYQFSAQTSGYADQHWESVATAALTPISAQLTFCNGHHHPTAFELQYADDKITVFYLSRHAPDTQQ